MAALAIVCGVDLVGCRRKRPEPVVTNPVAVVESTPGLPSPDAPKAGAPMPAMTAELMMKFEARFGRPPTNYTELSRLQSEPAKK